MGGTTHCSGTLEVKHEGEWRAVSGWSERVDSDWLQKASSVVCKQMDCGSAVTTERTRGHTSEPVWVISSCYYHDGDEFSLKQCEIESESSDPSRIKVICSGNTMT